MIKNNSRLMEETNRVGVQYLLVEVQTGLTFLNVAKTTELEENRVRSLQNALKAYLNVQRLLSQVAPLPDEKLELADGIEELKSGLKKAGVSFDF